MSRICPDLLLLLITLIKHMDAGIFSLINLVSMFDVGKKTKSGVEGTSLQFFSFLGICSQHSETA